MKSESPQVERKQYFSQAARWRMTDSQGSQLSRRVGRHGGVLRPLILSDRDDVTMYSQRLRNRKLKLNERDTCMTMISVPVNLNQLITHKTCKN